MLHYTPQSDNEALKHFKHVTSSAFHIQSSSYQLVLSEKAEIRSFFGEKYRHLLACLLSSSAIAHKDLGKEILPCAGK